MVDREWGDQDVTMPEQIMPTDEFSVEMGTVLSV